MHAKKLCSICLKSFPAEALTSGPDGRAVCSACGKRASGATAFVYLPANEGSTGEGASSFRRSGADRTSPEPRLAAPPRPRTATPPLPVPEPQLAATSSPGAAGGDDAAQQFGHAILGCLVRNDVESYRTLFLQDEHECSEVVDPSDAASHLALVRSRIERDFQSKRVFYLREVVGAAGTPDVRFISFKLGDTERLSPTAHRIRKSILQFDVYGVESRLVLQAIYRIGERYRLEFFE